MDIHPGKVFAFYSVYLTNWEELPFFGHFYPGRVYNFLENIHPWFEHHTVPSLLYSQYGRMDYKEISPSVLPPTSDVDSTDQLDEDKKLSDSLSVSTKGQYW